MSVRARRFWLDIGVALIGGLIVGGVVAVASRALDPLFFMISGITAIGLWVAIRVVRYRTWRAQHDPDNFAFLDLLWFFIG